MAGLVHSPIGHKFTPRSTPLHVVELLLVLLRASFSEMGEADFPFRYAQDSKDTKLFIDTPFNAINLQTGGRPSIIVARGPLSYSQQAVNNSAVHALKTGNEAKTSLMDAGFEFRVMARKPEEVEIVAHELMNVLVTCIDLLPKLTSIHKVLGLSLGVVGKMEQDEAMYACNIFMPCQVKYLWVAMPEQVILKAIDLSLNGSHSLLETT